MLIRLISREEFENWDDSWGSISPSLRDAEQFELHEENDPLQESAKGKKTTYVDGSTIGISSTPLNAERNLNFWVDWLHEEAIERSRQHRLKTLHGVRGLLLPLLDSTRTWFITIATGVGAGVIGAWLDVLVRWCGGKRLSWRNRTLIICYVRLSDLREGRCSYGFFYNQVTCCSGLDRECITSPCTKLCLYFSLQRVKYAQNG